MIRDLLCYLCFLLFELDLFYELQTQDTSRRDPRDRQGDQNDAVPKSPSDHKKTPAHPFGEQGKSGDPARILNSPPNYASAAHSAV